MVESGPGVEILMVVASEHKGDQEIRRESHDRDDQHGHGDHGFGLREARYGFAENFDRDREEGRAVDEGGEDFNSGESIAVTPAWSPRSQPDRSIAQGEREDVEEEMGRVGEERKTACEQSARVMMASIVIVAFPIAHCSLLRRFGTPGGARLD
jgi:hypothetical protein